MEEGSRHTSISTPTPDDKDCTGTGSDDTGSGSGSGDPVCRGGGTVGSWEHRICISRSFIDRPLVIPIRTHARTLVRTPRRYGEV
tara:strand:+ start:1886 stop:2140 length:255 start_codon:yes stop_codon:yes gene_type:complete